MQVVWDNQGSLQISFSYHYHNGFEKDSKFFHNVKRIEEEHTTSFKYTKSAWIHDKIAKMDQDFAFSMLKSIPAWKKYTTATASSSGSD